MRILDLDSFGATDFTTGLEQALARAAPSAAAGGAEHHVMRVEIPVRSAARRRAAPGGAAVGEHRLERCAGAHLEPPLHGAEAGPEEATDVGGDVRDPGVIRFVGRRSRTDLHTRGERREQGRIELARFEGKVHVVLEPAHRHRLRTLEPRGMKRRGAGGEQERHQGVRLRAREPAGAPGRGEGCEARAGAFDPQQGPRRPAEPLARPGVEAAEAHGLRAASVREGEQPRADPREPGPVEGGGAAEARIELARVRRVEARGERRHEG